VLTGAGTAIALIGMVTSFQVSAAVAAQNAEIAANIAAADAAAASGVNDRGQGVRVLDPSLLPEIVIPTPAPRAPSSAAQSAPAAPAPAPARPAPQADGNTGGSGG
jgi:2-oxoglutarate dehydrogenase E2 component (dihydrolipoamide succinyltransferase)